METLFSAKQLNCENSRPVSQPWGRAPLRLESSALILDGLLCSALFCSVPSALSCAFLPCDGLLHSVLVRHLWGFSPARKIQSSFFGRIGKGRSPSQKGASLHGWKSLPLVPDWSVLMHIMTPNPCSLIGPKNPLSLLIKIELHWLATVAQLWLDGESFHTIGWNRKVL